MGKRKLTEKQEKEIIKEYTAQKCSLSSLAQIYPVSLETIRKTLNENGIDTAQKLTISMRDEMFKSFKSGEVTMTSLANQYDIAIPTVHYWLKKEGLDLSLSPLSRKYFIDFNVLEKDSFQKYYWLGFIIADGNIYKDYLTIALKKKDYGHLKKLCTFLKTKDNVKLYCRKQPKGYGYAQFCIKSKKLVGLLENYGIIPNKSLTVFPTNIPNKFLGAFMLGFFDGDGSIWVRTRKNNKREWAINFTTGSIKMAKFINRFLQGVISREIVPYKQKTSNTLGITLYKKRDINNILKEMYYKDNGFSLDRKKELSMKFMEEYKYGN